MSRMNELAACCDEAVEEGISLEKFLEKCKQLFETDLSSMATFYYNNAMARRFS